MITTPTVSGKPGQAPTGLSCDLYPQSALTGPGPILEVHNQDTRPCSRFRRSDAAGGRNRVRTCDPLLVRQTPLNAVQTTGLSVKPTSASRKLWAH